MAGESVGRIHNGPDGFTSHLSDSPITPGPGTGIDSEGVIQPAWAADTPSPHPARSNTVASPPPPATGKPPAPAPPPRAREPATHTPPAPPPMMITRTPD